MKKKIAWIMAATTLGVTGVGAVTGYMPAAFASVAIGAVALAAALGVRRQAKMATMDAEVMYAMR
jgi:hypothetical protein